MSILFLTVLERNPVYHVSQKRGGPGVGAKRKLYCSYPMRLSSRQLSGKPPRGSPSSSHDAGRGKDRVKGWEHAILYVTSDPADSPGLLCTDHSFPCFAATLLCQPFPRVDSRLCLSAISCCEPCSLLGSQYSPAYSYLTFNLPQEMASVFLGCHSAPFPSTSMSN